MGKGPIWTDEEKSALMNLYHDNESTNFADITSIAERYGMFPNRSFHAIKSALYRFVEEERKAAETPTEQLELDLEERYDPELIYAQNEVKYWKTRYCELFGLMLDTAKPSPSGRVWLNATPILRWMYENEPVAMADKEEEFKEVTNAN